MIEDSASIEVPVRSRLFNLPMSGHCGATQESLLSYTQRVCAAHHVPIRRMLIEVMLPEAGLSSLVSGEGSKRSLEPRSVLRLSACSEQSSNFALAMQRLTGRRDLGRGTFLPWQGLLGSGIAMEQRRRWCAHCVGDQRDREHVAFSLLWTLRDVRACPIHKAMLLDRCVRCDHTQPIIGDRLTQGHCEHCGLHLGDALQCEGSAAASARDLFNAEAVAEIVSMGDSAADVLTVARYRGRMEQIKHEHCCGSLYKLGRKLQLGRRLLERDGGTTLASLLEITYRLGVKPLAFLTGAGAPSPECVVRSSAYRAQLRRSPDALEALRQQLASHIHEALQNKGRVIRLVDLTRRVHLAANSIYSLYPELVAVVRQHNARARPIQREERRIRLESAARTTIRNLIERGGRVNSRSVNEALAAAGVHWSDTAAKAAANDELAKLRRDEA